MKYLFHGLMYGLMSCFLLLGAVHAAETEPPNPKTPPTLSADPALAGLTVDRGIALCVPGSKTAIELAASGRFVVHALAVNEAARVSLAALLTAADSPAGLVHAETLRDGLIATDGRLYVACADGSVRCFHDR